MGNNIALPPPRFIRAEGPGEEGTTMKTLNELEKFSDFEIRKTPSFIGGQRTEEIVRIYADGKIWEKGEHICEVGVQSDFTKRIWEISA